MTKPVRPRGLLVATVLVAIVTITMFSLGVYFRGPDARTYLTCEQLDQTLLNNLIGQGYSEEEAKNLLNYAKGRALSWDCRREGRSTENGLQATATVLKVTATVLEETEKELAVRQQAVETLTTEQLTVVRAAWEEAWADAQKQASREAVLLQVLFTVIQLLGGWIIGQFLTVGMLTRWLKRNKDKTTALDSAADDMQP